MEDMNNTTYVKASDYFGSEIKAVPKDPPAIGIDMSDSLLQNIVAAGEGNALNVAELSSFSQSSMTRNDTYNLIDSMCEDPIVSAVLETYAEDSTEYSDEGKVVWATSEDSRVADYANHLIKALSIEKNIFNWAYCLCKYGDVYVRLYRKSELNKNQKYEKEDPHSKRKKFDESIIVKAFKSSDQYARYIEMEKNPAEMFDLRQYGKTVGFIKAPISNINAQSSNPWENDLQHQYSFTDNDVEIFQSTSYAHASLQESQTRVKEEITISSSEDSSRSETYSVSRGQSLFYNVFKIWRQLMLLENSLILNRVNRSNVIVDLEVEVASMAKPDVQNHLRHIKSLVEQKTALDTNKNLSEYNNPGPVINYIYTPTRNGVGKISPNIIGGDVNVKDIEDVNYIQDKFYGALRVPKAYFGVTDDGAGFNGGTSLAIISSRYAKMIKRIQFSLCQLVTDIINLYAINAKLPSYVNKFTVHLVPPTTQEELDRRDNLSARVDIVSNIMNLMADIESNATKTRILQILVSSLPINPEVASTLEDVVEQLEKDELETKSLENSADDSSKDSESKDNIEDLSVLDRPEDNIGFDTEDAESKEPTETTYDAESNSNTETKEKKKGQFIMPNPEDIGIDFSDNSNF